MIYREQVLKFLKEKQETEGGYYGNDLTTLSGLLMVTPRGLRKRLSGWIKNDKEFQQFTYLGKERPSVTLFEFFEIEQELTSNPIQVKKGIHEDIQEQRKAQNQKPLSKPTFYRAARQKILSIYCSETCNWFKAKEIPFPENYSIEDNRESLKTIFTFSDLKTYGGADIEAIYQKLLKARECFSIYKVEAIRFYPEILSRSRFLKKLLSSIPPNQQSEAQAKLIFEIQTSFIVECTDLLIDELIRKQGRIRQSDNASRQKVENQLRKEVLDSFRDEFKDLNDSDKIDVKIIKKIFKCINKRGTACPHNVIKTTLRCISINPEDEPELGRVMAMRKHVYMDKLNVRKLVEDFGYLILKNVSQKGFPIDNICNAVERSNNLKKKARIVEGSRTRVEPDEAELLLKSAELILCIVGLYHLLKGWQGHGSPINLSDVRLIRPA